MAKIEAKQPVVQEISDLLDGAQSAVLVDFMGIPVDADTELRRQLREGGVTYRVYKNTLMKLAMKGTDFEKLGDDLKGPSAIAVSKTDPTAPARIVANFAKDHEQISLKAGIVEGDYFDAKSILDIARIPGKEELLSRLCGSLQSPISSFARAIKQVAEKKESGADAPAAEAAPAEEAAPASDAAPAAEAAPAEGAAPAQAPEA